MTEQSSDRGKMHPSCVDGFKMSSATSSALLVFTLGGKKLLKQNEVLVQSKSRINCQLTQSKRV